MIKKFQFLDKKSVIRLIFKIAKFKSSLFIYNFDCPAQICTVDQKITKILIFSLLILYLHRVFLF